MFRSSTTKPPPAPQPQLHSQPPPVSTPPGLAPPAHRLLAEARERPPDLLHQPNQHQQSQPQQNQQHQNQQQHKWSRLAPLTIEEYELKYRRSASDYELAERVFLGGMSCNQLRTALWPYLFRLVPYRGKFERVQTTPGGSSRSPGFGGLGGLGERDSHGSASQGRSPCKTQSYVFVEHKRNVAKWNDLRQLYFLYQKQWKSITSDQELRFSLFRERRSIIERDVIRCDRLHPFYAQQSQNLSTLTSLLMTYMMYDFDIGYVQGMSDLAAPILYMYRGDLIKSFWVFVEVMKLFRRNFELTQKTIHFQLSCLFELIRQTDAKLADYLEEHESSNCFFAFRQILCQFKRELMKEDENDYSKVLRLWDTIWCANRLGQPASANNSAKSKSKDHCDNNQASVYPSLTKFDPNQSNTPRQNLTETETFVLALCLAMIRRERDTILARRLDGTDIHLHFIDPKLGSDLNGFIGDATGVYWFLKHDFDIKKLTAPQMADPNKKKNNAKKNSSSNAISIVPASNGNGSKGGAAANNNNYNSHNTNTNSHNHHHKHNNSTRANQTPTVTHVAESLSSIEGYDFLSDFLIINGVNGTPT